MKTKVAKTGAFLAGIALSASLIAGPVTLPHTFSANTTARASEVNANFTAVKSAVDDNDNRLSTIETAVTGSNNRLTMVETAVTGDNNRLTTIEATVSGANVVLAPSTNSGGNVLKGADPFIHNFGTDNTFIGLHAGNFTMTGDGGNTAVGVRALVSNIDGSFNTASGLNALTRNTTGYLNTASGMDALARNTTGRSNTASGASALQGNTTGGFNTASGVNALANNTTGNSNTAIGAYALLSNTAGGRNIAIGESAGVNLTTGSSNIAIGHSGEAGEANTTRIGFPGAQTRAFIAGINGVPVSGAAVLVNSAGQLGVQSSSRAVKDTITDMDRASRVLMQLRPVTFYYKSDTNPGGRSLQYGLIAEEVAKVAPGLVARDAKGEIQTVYYQFLPPMLLNEYQKQQRTIEAQAAEISELKRQMGRMAVTLARLEAPPTITASAR